MLEHKSFQDEEAFNAYKYLFKKYPGLHINLDKNAQLSIEDVAELERILRDLKEL